MADNRNIITVVGNLTRDPEVRVTNSGDSVLSLSIASNRTWTDRSGETHEETDFFDVEAWRSLASNAADSLTKGTRVVVVGRLKQKAYETQTGERRTRYVIVADEIAPSLVWATAEVTRTAGSGASANGGQSATAKTPSASPTEEPF